MHTNNNIERFIAAQNDFPQNYQTALTQMKAGCKKTHWIWYIFPQRRPDHNKGSQYTQYYGLSDDAEATRYLHHPILGPRLAEITAVVYTQLCVNKNIPPEVLLMWDKDVKKVRSCMKLFIRVGKKADATTLPWLPTFLAQAQAIFQLLDIPKYQ
jgi:uncharacterized protein (DUF1810 family)